VRRALPFVFTGSFLLAVFLLQWWQLPAYPLRVWLSVAGLVFGGTVMRHKGMPIVAGAAGIALAFVSIARVTTLPSERPVEAFADAKVAIEGTVLGQPDDRQTKILYTVRVTSVQSGTGVVVPIQDTVLITDRKMAVRLNPGNRLRAQGKLTLPKNTDDFAYATFLAMDGVHAEMNAQNIERISEGTAGMQGLLWKSRTAFEAHIGHIYPEPAASLLSGLLTGSRRGLPAGLTADFRTTGLSHIVAVSGSNITVILSVIIGLLFFLPMKWRVAPGTAAIILFTLFVGAEASVVRAAIMGILGLCALQTERLSNIRLAIMWTAFFMLLWNPLQLWVDMGFQLSFLAVIGLAELNGILQPYFEKLPKAGGVREALLATIAAQITTTPWAADRFGMISLIAPLSNVLAAPLVPFAMFAGFAGVAVGAVSETLGTIVGYPGLLALEGLIFIAETTAAIPYASINIPVIGPVFITLYYVSLACLVIPINRSHAGLPLIQIHRYFPAKPQHTNFFQRTYIFKAKGLADHVRSGP
jgi:competence protein ComEC